MTTAGGRQQQRLVGFRRDLRPEVVAGDAVYLIAECGVTALKGAGIEAVAPLLDGTRDLATLLHDLPPTVSTAEVGELVLRLAEAGLITVRGPDGATACERQLAYWDATGLDAAVATAGLQSRTVRLLAVGEVDLWAARGALVASGLRMADERGSVADGAAAAPKADLAVVLCDDYLSAELPDLDAELRASGTPYLLAKPDGVRVWIGPFFEPHGKPCWHCLAARLWGHRQAEAHVRSTLGRRSARRPVASLPASTATAMHLVALKATEWVAGHRGPAQRCVWTLDSLDLTGRKHEVRGRPQCPSCGDPDLMRDKAWRVVDLAPRPKASRRGGGHRACHPREVLDAYGHLVGPVTGIAPEITPDRRGHPFFDTCRSGHNVAAGGRSMEALRSALRAQNGGKGVSPLHAEVGALCEAIERHSGQHQGDEAVVRASLRSLGAAAVHPNAIQLYDERQYATRERWNGAHGAFHHVCAPVDPDEVVDWTPAWSLRDGALRFVTSAQAWFGAPVPASGSVLGADSNGCAAGASVEDAVLQGMLELVERDAVALWWYNRTAQPGVDLDALCDRWVDETREAHETLGRTVWALDLTSDLGVPVVAALSRRADGPRERIVLGFGAHLDPHVAAVRALTELNQMMPAACAAEDDERLFTGLDPDASAWWHGAAVSNQPYLLPAAGVPARRPQEIARAGVAASDCLLADVTAVRSRIEAAGCEVLVIDQTRPDIGLPVVRVLAPGLRHFWARFAPGRLFDVPVQLGRRAEPIAYEELNPVPLFL